MYQGFQPLNTMMSCHNNCSSLPDVFLCNTIFKCNEIQSYKMEEYPKIKNFGHSIRLLTLAGAAIALLTSCLLTGVSYAILSSSLPAKNLPSVKITSPHKGQQLPVSGNIIVLGIASPPAADKTITGCGVSVSLNGVKPYQKAVATGHGGTTDYSSWRYAITPNYSALKHGQNKITAKISCLATPTNLTKFNSVNVTGI
jgi:hypothetical protein